MGKPFQPSDQRDPASAEEISRVIGEVKAFYKVGQRSLREHGDRIPYGQYSKAAEKLGVTSEDLRKARVFADSTHGYTRPELNHLCREMRRLKAAVGTAALRVLPAIKDKGDRKKFQHEAMIHRWTFKELVAEKRMRFGKSKERGRTFVMHNTNEARNTFLQLARALQRYFKQLNDQLKNDPITALLSVFEEEERDRFAAVERALNKAIKLQEVFESIRRKKNRRKVQQHSR